MALYGASLVAQYVAWNTETNLPASSDAANHTLYLVRDGVSSSPTNTPTDVVNGVCALSITATEMRCGCLTLSGTSVSPNVVILPLTIVTERQAGSSTVTITVSDGDTVYPGVKVSICNVAETSPQWVEYTDSNGQIVTYLPSGTWRAIAGANAEQGGGATNFTVSGTMSVAVSVTGRALPSPASGGYCTVFCDAETLSGSVPSGYFTVSKQHSPLYRSAGSFKVSIVKGDDRPTLDTSGRAILEILQGADVTLQLVSGGVTKTRRVTIPPTEGPISWEDITLTDT